MKTDEPAGPTARDDLADLDPLWRSKDQKAWYWYDWANSRLLHHRLVGPVRALHDHGRRQGGRLHRPGRDLQQDGQRAWARPRRRLAAVLPHELRHHRERVRAAGRRCVRGPLVPQEVAHGRLRVGRVVLLRPAVLHAGRAAGSSAPSPSCWRACWAAARWSATTRSWSTSRPRTSATTCRRVGGRSAISAAAAAGPEPGRLPRPRHLRTGRGHGRPALVAVCRRVVGGLHDHPDGAAAQLRRRATSSPPRARSSTAASGSCTRRCRRCVGSR